MFLVHLVHSFESTLSLHNHPLCLSSLKNTCKWHRAATEQPHTSTLIKLVCYEWLDIVPVFTGEVLLQGLINPLFKHCFLLVQLLVFFFVFFFLETHEEVSFPDKVSVCLLSRCCHSLLWVAKLFRDHQTRVVFGWKCVFLITPPI